MKVILFGATGMVGQGVLRECVLDPGVETVLAITRSDAGPQPEKVEVIVLPDFFDFTAVSDALRGYDACLFCLGVSSAGMAEAEYTRLTYDLTLRAAEAVLKSSPDVTFLYVSGSGTDSTEKGRSMWARVKGRTENALLRMPFQRAYMFRPGYIQPMGGIRSKTRLYRLMYLFLAPLYPLLRALAPKYVVTTEEVGRAMLVVARSGYPKRVLESEDIARVSGLRRARG